MLRVMQAIRSFARWAFAFGLLGLWSAPSGAQEQEPPAKAEPPAQTPPAPFVDRDGDGIHDAMQHRFRRHKRGHGKRHGGNAGGQPQQRQQGGPPK